MNFNINDIISQIPEDFSDIEKVRYVYLKCGELFAYNRDFVYLYFEDEAREIYEQSFNWKSVQNKKEGRIIVTCNQVATGCTDAINMLSCNGKTKNIVRARNIGYVYGKQFHVATLLEIGEKKYFLDLYKDLFRIQKGMRTKYFAPSKEIFEREKFEYPSISEQLEGIKCETISEDELTMMDKKGGYNRNGVYMDDALIQLKKEMNQVKEINEIKLLVGDIDEENKERLILKFKLDFISKYLMNNNEEGVLDINELTKFFKKAYYTLLSEREIKENTLYATPIHYNRMPSVIFTINKYNNPINYIYKGKDVGLEIISEEELKELKKKKEITDDTIITR